MLVGLILADTAERCTEATSDDTTDFRNPVASLALAQNSENSAERLAADSPENSAADIPEDSAADIPVGNSIAAGPAENLAAGSPAEDSAAGQLLECSAAESFLAENSAADSFPERPAHTPNPHSESAGKLAVAATAAADTAAARISSAVLEVTHTAEDLQGQSQDLDCPHCRPPPSR